MVQLLGVCMAADRLLYGDVDLLDHARSGVELPGAAVGIAVINATGNISSALNPVIVGWLKDLTASFATELIYASIMLALGCAVMLIVPVPKTEPRSAINAVA